MLSAKVPFHRSIRFRLSLVIAVVIFAAVMAASALSALRDLRQQSDARAEMLEKVRAYNFCRRAPSRRAAAEAAQCLTAAADLPEAA